MFSSAQELPSYVNNVFVFLHLVKRWVPSLQDKTPPKQDTTIHEEVISSLNELFKERNKLRFLTVNGLPVNQLNCTTVHSCMPCDLVPMVVKDGHNTDVLLFNQPAPHAAPLFRHAFGSPALIDANEDTYHGMVDYYAAKMFIEQACCTNSTKWVVFVGTKAHGTCGFYHFLSTHSNLQLVKMLTNGMSLLVLKIN